MRRGTRLVVGAALALLLAGCSQSSTGPLATTPPGPSPSPSTFDPSQSTSTYLPAGVEPGATVPIVVLVPGGGWQTHNSLPLVPLAQGLADDGYLVATTEYRAGVDGVGFPESLQDVQCSAAFVVAEARRSGFVPGPVVLVGHSAGGHLSALAAVSGTSLARTCADPIPAIDGVVGLAGVYNSDFQLALQSFFGVRRAQDPALWASGSPSRYVLDGKAPRSLHVLLVHGDDDEVVPLNQSTTFAQVLRDAGIPVTLDVLPGETHMSVIAVGVVERPIDAWLRTWAVP